MQALTDNEKFDLYLKDKLQVAEMDLPANSWEKLQLKRASLAYKQTLKKRLLRLGLIFFTFSILLTALLTLLLNHAVIYKGITDQRKSIAISKTVSPAVNHNDNNANLNKPVMAVKNHIASAMVQPINNIQPGNQAEIKKTVKQDIANEKQVSNESKNNTIVNKPAEPAQVKEAVTKTENKMDSATTPVAVKTLADTLTKKVANTTKDASALAPNKKTKQKETNSNEWHFGPQYTYNSRWIFHENTYNEPQFHGKLLQYIVSWGSSYGIMAGYDVERKYGFQAGIIFNSVEGQNYDDNFSFGEIKREIKLDYMHIPVLYKKKVYLSNNTYPIILDFITGLQYGMLKSATETVNDSTKDIKDHFHQSEIGIVINVESDFYLNNFLYLNFGLDSYISNNINAKAWPVKGSYRMSHNCLIGVNVGVNYYLPSW